MCEISATSLDTSCEPLAYRTAYTTEGFVLIKLTVIVENSTIVYLHQNYIITSTNTVQKCNTCLFKIELVVFFELLILLFVHKHLVLLQQQLDR